MSVVFLLQMGGGTCDIINKRGCYYEEESFMRLSDLFTNEFWLRKYKERKQR